MVTKEDEEWKRFKGTKKECTKKKLEWLNEGYVCFMERYDEKLWCVVCRRV